MAGPLPLLAKWVDGPIAIWTQQPIGRKVGAQTDREHRLAGYHFDSDTGEHEARCSCGWVSPPFTDPNVAGAIWDSHIAGSGAALTSPCASGH